MARSRSLLRRLTAGVASLLAIGCSGDAATSTTQNAQVIVSFLTPATVRVLTLEISGPGIEPAVVVNLPVQPNATAADTLTLPAGSARRFRITATDTAGVRTHQADTSITLVAGTNPPLALRLDPLVSALGVTVTFGGASVTVADTTTRIRLIGDSVRINASARTAAGVVVPLDQLTWGVSNPAVASVTGGMVRLLREGEATVAVSYEGAAVRVRISAVTILPEAVVDVQAGGPYSCARRQNGSVWCWGTLPSGAYLATPTDIAPDLRWRAFSTGFSSMCGVTVDRVAYCWGNNAFGQLGTGAVPANSAVGTPQRVAGDLTWDEIVVGNYSACGNTYPAGLVYCWGGVGATAGTEGSILATASVAPSPANASLRNLTVGSGGVCGAAVTDGRPFCLGNFALEFLDGATLMTAPEAITRTDATGRSTACSVTAGGKAFCFGNFNGTDVVRASQIEVGSGITWDRFFSGRTLHFCGVDTERRGYCWGTNARGQVGDSTTTYRATPFQLPGRWRKLSAALGIFGPGNRDHTCGLTEARTVLCWGEGQSGQLGNGNAQSSLAPVVVPLQP